MQSRLELMMKCDLCYDRTSEGLRPMCATVCPSQALTYVRPAEISRRSELPTNLFQFGNQKVTTRVFMMVPPGHDQVTVDGVDVVDLIWEPDVMETLS
jgi:Fe-S-cluster-containing dehydrogenase component